MVSAMWGYKCRAGQSRKVGVWYGQVEVIEIGVVACVCTCKCRCGIIYDGKCKEMQVG